MTTDTHTHTLMDSVSDNVDRQTERQREDRDRETERLEEEYTQISHFQSSHICFRAATVNS